jgi:hypothetical protein
VHGGLFSRDGVTLDEIRKIQRIGQQPGNDGLMCEVGGFTRSIVFFLLPVHSCPPASMDRSARTARPRAKQTGTCRHDQGYIFIINVDTRESASDLDLT